MVAPAVWDARTTDMWIRQLDATGNVVNSWNILQGQVPLIPQGAQYRVDVRAHNYGSSVINLRLAAQAIGHKTGTQGSVIYTGYGGDMTPGKEVVFYHWITMWAEPVDLRLWLDNQYTGSPIGSGNAPAGQAPPWQPVYAQGELFDFALSSRHVTALSLAGAAGSSIVANAQISGSTQGIANATIQLVNGMGNTVATQVTDPTGSVQFDNLPPDAYTVQAQSNFYSFSLITNIIVPPNKTVTLLGTPTGTNQPPPGGDGVTPPPISNAVTTTISVYDSTTDGGILKFLPNIQINIDGNAAGSTGASGSLIVAQIAIGKHTVTAHDPTGAYIDATVTVSISTNGQQWSVAMTPVTAPPPGGGGGPPTGGGGTNTTTYEALGVVVAILIVGAVITLAGRKKGGK